MHIVLKSFLLAPLVFAAACSSSPSSESAAGSTGTATTSTSSGGGTTIDQACSDSAHVSCTQRDKCSNDNANKLHFGDEATCESRTKLTCASSLAATGTGQTPTKIEACGADYGSYACSDFLEDNPPAVCVPPAGTGAVGSACGAPAQCASTYCAVAEYAVCGTCQPLPVVGATCTVATDCGRDLACPIVAPATTGTCAEYVVSGGGCDDTHPCAPDLSCVGAVLAPPTMGKCMPAGATVGAMCDGSKATAAGCDGQLGLVCVPTAKGSAIGSCATIELVAAAAKCGDIGAAPITGFADCEAGGSCVKAVATDNTGICSAPAADGSACDSDPTKGPGCLSPAKCVPTTAGQTAGTCTVPDATKCK